MEPFDLITLAAPIALVLGGVIGAALGRWFSDSHGEWKELAQVREEANEDLRRRVTELEQKAAHLEGQLQAYMALKSDEIVLKVIQGLEKGITVNG